MIRTSKEKSKWRFIWNYVDLWQEKVTVSCLQCVCYHIWKTVGQRPVTNHPTNKKGTKHFKATFLTLNFFDQKIETKGIGCLNLIRKQLQSINVVILYSLPDMGNFTHTVFLSPLYCTPINISREFPVFYWKVMSKNYNKRSPSIFTERLHQPHSQSKKASRL